MPNIKVLVYENKFTTREGIENDDWDRGDTRVERTIEGIEVVKEKDYFDLKTKIKLKKDVPYYLLFTEYSTADSFGSDVNSGIEFIELYDTLLKANKGLSSLKKSKTNKSFSYISNTISIPLNDGTEYKLYIPWNGYFEDIENQGIQVVMLV